MCRIPEQKLKIVQRSLEDVAGELKKAEIEKKEIDLLVAKTFPDGNIKTSEDLQMTLTMLKDTLTEKQGKKTELNAQLGYCGSGKANSSGQGQGGGEVSDGQGPKTCP